MSILLLSIGFGLVTASVLAIAGVGLSLQFGVTNFVNFAYGDYATFGAYVALVLNEHGVNIYLAMLAAGVVTAIFAALVNRFVFQHFIKQRVKVVILLVVTIGVSLVIEYALQSIFGAQFQTYIITNPNPLHVGPFLLTAGQLAIIGIALACMLGVHLLLSRTRVGKAMRAMSDNAALAEVSGIDTMRITDLTWLVVGFLGGIAGVVLAMNTSTFTPLLGSFFLLLLFAVVILGGIGKPYGAMLGALIIGVVTEVSGAYINAAYQDAVAFVIMIILLLVRPQGLFTSRGRA